MELDYILILGIVFKNKKNLNNMRLLGLRPKPSGFALRAEGFIRFFPQAPGLATGSRRGQQDFSAYHTRTSAIV